MAMTPIHIDGRFGWLHAPADGGHAPVGVVLCPAFAQEEVCTHHGLMALGEALAARRVAAVRFDYGGTGDSIDGPVTLDGLVADAEAAAAWLRDHAHVDRVMLAGVRLGAAVAMLAAKRLDDVSALVLLAPVLSGQAFLRETRASAAVASLSGLDPVPPLESDQPLNTNGFRWTAAFQREVAAIDLTVVEAPVETALFVPPRTDRRSGKLAQRWRDAGGAATELPFADYDGWMQDPTTNETPVATFAAVADWVAQHAGTPAGAPIEPLRDAISLTTDSYIEEPLRFGPDDALFGMLCRPAGHPAAPVAALLMHEGSTHHIGNGRAYVRLARRLAAEGFASLRMDLTGMGDSPAGDNPRHPHYDPERIPEGVASLDCLEAHGFPRAIVTGLCSGAHTALQVTLADERAVGSVVLNLQKFIWHYGDDIRVAVRDNKRSLKGYIRAMRNPGEWRRMLKGEADLPGIARVLAKRSAIRLRHAATSLLPPKPGSEAAQVREQLQTLSARGAHVHLVFSDEDPGLADMGMKLGRGARLLRQYPPVRMVTLDRADHHFNGTLARDRHIEMMIAAMTDAVTAHGAGLPPVSPRTELSAAAE